MEDDRHVLRGEPFGERVDLAVFQRDIEDGEIGRRAIAGKAGRRDTGVRADHFEAGFLDRVAQIEGDHRFVFSHQNPLRHHALPALQWGA